MDNALETNDGEESSCNGGGRNGDEDEQTEQASRVAAALALEEEVGAGDGGVDGHGGVMDGEMQATEETSRRARCRFNAQAVVSSWLGARCPFAPTGV